MKITSVNVRKIEREGSRLKGIASVLIDESLVIRDIKIIDGDRGLFLAMPHRKTSTGTYKDVVFPINSDVRSMFEEEIFAEYERTELSPTEEEPIVDEE